MGKMKRFSRKKSIKYAYAGSVLACMLCGISLSLICSGICQWGQAMYYNRCKEAYGICDREVKIDFENDFREGKRGIAIYQTPVGMEDYFTPVDRTVYDFLGALSVAVYPVCFVLCIAVTSVLFYRRQLQRPLEVLEDAAAQIAANNLDFTVSCDRPDELGRLCLSFDRMRYALRENNEEMWRQMEERKQLNAAFSHDLRTPLTVLKGQSELLIAYGPKMTAEKVTRTAEMMRRHIMRLEKYVDTMNELQRLPDLVIEYHPVPVQALLEPIRQEGESLCREKGLIFRISESGGKEAPSDLFLDLSVVMRVFENLMSNAVRFADREVCVLVRREEDRLQLEVRDDGAGFTKKDLSRATNPFYRAEGEKEEGHLGMGLNICKILCEKHGGCLRLNNREGAAVTAEFDCRPQDAKFISESR